MIIDQKLKLAIKALETIKNWDEECEELWSDPGECASEALNLLNQ